MKIVIDAGHGKNTYRDTGSKGVPGMAEFEFNSATANHVKNLLNKYQGVEAVFTHDSTRDVPLTERTNKANAIKADVFVSIHANAGVSSATGIETFVYTTKPKEAVALATKVQNNLIKETGLRNRGVKSENFHVLRETHMTAILVECGFMTNISDLAQLKSDAYRRKCAKAIVDGIVSQYGLKAKPQSTPKPVASSNTFYRVVTGSFSDKGNAEARVEALKKAGFDSFIDAYQK